MLAIYNTQLFIDKCIIYDENNAFIYLFSTQVHMH